MIDARRCCRCRGHRTRKGNALATMKERGGRAAVPGQARGAGRSLAWGIVVTALHDAEALEHIDDQREGSAQLGGLYSGRWTVSLASEPRSIREEAAGALAGQPRH